YSDLYDRSVAEFDDTGSSHSPHGSSKSCTTCPSYPSGLHLVVPSCSGLDPVELLYLYPHFNAERLEVHWYWSGDFNRPAKLYKDHTIQDGPVDPRYRGRVSLTGGLERGNVSLTLEKITLEDRKYRCRVSNAQWYEKASVFLTVNGNGLKTALCLCRTCGMGRCSAFRKYSHPLTFCTFCCIIA
uniref:Ig-like domain-containing protein n=1 Tax=Salmo trutta TaxID=8032 RepID=A0A673Y7G3_SALTR